MGEKFGQNILGARINEDQPLKKFVLGHLTENSLLALIRNDLK